MKVVIEVEVEVALGQLRAKITPDGWRSDDPELAAYLNRLAPIDEEAPGEYVPNRVIRALSMARARAPFSLSVRRVRKATFRVPKDADFGAPPASSGKIES